MSTGFSFLTANYQDNVLRNRVATVDVDFKVDGIRNSGSRICYAEGFGSWRTLKQEMILSTLSRSRI